MRYLYLLLAVCVLSGQSAIDIRPDENLYDYKARMDAVFAPRIAANDPELTAEGSEYNAYLQFMSFWEPRLHGHGDFNRYYKLEDNFQNRYNRGRRRIIAHGSIVGDGATIVNTVPWQEIGPTSIPAGGNGIGPVEFLIFHRTSPTHMLCGSTAGGLFYSNNGAASWKHTGTDTETGRSGVSSAAFHPTDYRTWFIASSDNNTHNEAGPIGITGGVFRTTDEGVTWSQIGYSGQLGGMSTKINKIETIPGNPGQLWAATSNGLYVTNDALVKTQTWTLAVPGVAYDFEVRPGDPSWLYATVRDSKGWRFIESDDGGASWQNVQNPPATTSATFLTIEVSPAKADNLYCHVGRAGSNGELFIYDYATKQPKLVRGSIYSLQGGGHGFGVDRVNANRIYLSEDVRATRYDYGGNPASRWLASGYHDDVEDFVSDPLNAGHIWVCSHGGVSLSQDDGASWSDRSTGLGVAQPVGMASAASDPRYVALGLYHDGTVLTTSPWSANWTPSWKRLFGGDGMRPVVSPLGQFIWVSYVVKGGDNPWLRFTNYGQTYALNGPDSPQWAISSATLTSTPNIQYRVGTDQTIRRTLDDGTTWSAPISDFYKIYFPPAAPYYGIDAIFTTEANADYAAAHLLVLPPGTNKTDSYLYRTKQATAAPATVINSWQQIALPAKQTVSDVEFDPIDPEILYVAFQASSASPSSTIGSGMIFRCRGTGNCVDITQNLPNATTGRDSLAIATDGTGGLYYVCDFGSFYSNDATRNAGNGWRPLGTLLPNTPFNGIEINDINKKVRVASQGRGAWEHDLVATVSGTLFHDLNHNSKRDPGEPPLANWDVTLTDGSSKATAITDANGRYTFPALAAGTYTVSQSVQYGWTQTLPASGPQSITVTAGAWLKNVDFGDDLTPRTSCIWQAPNLVAWWRFQQTSAPLGDLAGFDNALTSFGNPQSTTGKVADAFSFNGASQYFETPTHPELNTGTGDFTIAAWIRTTSNSLQGIVDKRDNAYLGYSFYVIAGRLGVQMTDRPGSSSCSTDNTTSACTNWGTAPGVVQLADGQWHHVAVTIDRHNTAGGLLYVDGAIAAVFDPTIRDRSLDNLAPLRIGSANAGSDQWQGDLDEVQLYKKSLTPYEVQTIYKADRYGVCTGRECNPNCY